MDLEHVLKLFLELFIEAVTRAALEGFVSQSLSRAEPRSPFWSTCLELALRQLVKVIVGSRVIPGVFFKACSIIPEIELEPELDLE